MANNSNFTQYIKEEIERYERIIATEKEELEKFESDLKNWRIGSKKSGIVLMQQINLRRAKIQHYKDEIKHAEHLIEAYYKK